MATYTITTDVYNRATVSQDDRRKFHMHDSGSVLLSRQQGGVLGQLNGLH